MELTYKALGMNCRSLIGVINRYNNDRKQRTSDIDLAYTEIITELDNLKKSYPRKMSVAKEILIIHEIIRRLYGKNNTFLKKRLSARIKKLETQLDQIDI